MNKEVKLLSFVFFLAGVILILNRSFNFTGAVIGYYNSLPSLSTILGLIFIIFSIILFIFKDSLEQKLNQVEDADLQNSKPIIIDTNYLIESCRNPLVYKNLLRFVKDHHDQGRPVIVPKRVYDEFKGVVRDSGEIHRIKNLKESLLKYSITLEDIRGNVWENPIRKIKYNNIAKKIIYQTPKYLAYKYLSEIEKGENIPVNKFLNKSLGKLSNAFSYEKYENDLENARRKYDSASIKERKNILHNYDVSPADIEVLSSALYLQNVPDVHGDHLLDKIKIITKDSHLVDSSKIFGNMYRKRKDKIEIVEVI